MPSLNTKLASAPNTSSNYVLKATSSTTIGNSLIQDDGTTITLTGALSGTSATFVGSIQSTGGTGFATSIDGGFRLRNNANNGNLGGLTRRSYWAGGAALDTQIFAETGYGIFLNVNGSSTTGMTITSAGNVGIGTTSPSNKLDVIDDRTNYGVLKLQNSSVSGYSSMEVFNSSGSQVGAMGYANASASVTAGNMYTYSSGAITFLAGGTTERMRITSGGKVGINGFDTGVQLYIKSTTTTSSDYPLYLSNSSAGIFYVRSDGYIFTGTGSGSPYNNTSGAAANMVVNSGGGIERSTASSQRFKENIIDWDGNGLDTILALKPKTFTYKEDYYSNPERQFLGLIAEEVAEVSSYLADFENEDGTGQVENVRYANIVVPLIKAIQEQQSIIDGLNQRLNALENK